jgi:hypothetical protein
MATATTDKPLFSLIDGIKAKTEGQIQVEQHSGGFVGWMRELAIDRALHHGTVDSDYLRAYAEEEEIKAHHPNAWGAIFRGKGWRVVGWKRSEFVSNHGRTIKVWSYTEEERT